MNSTPFRLWRTAGAVWFVLAGFGTASGQGTAAQGSSGQAVSPAHLVVASVPVEQAVATGVLEVSAGRNVLGGASSVSAVAAPATVTLVRGGSLRVCQRSALHLTEGAATEVSGQQRALLLALDHGAAELTLPFSHADAVLTPDLRITRVPGGGSTEALDLQLRTAANGDTCLDNRGRHAPTLMLNDSFGESSYLLKPGQHILLEHGSLREVVDRETESCGCPANDPASLSLADAALRGHQNGMGQGGDGHAADSGKPADTFPFPTAASEGLAAPAPLPAQSVGQNHVQVSSQLAYNPNAANPDQQPLLREPAPPGITLPPESTTGRTLPNSAQKPGFFGSIGHFFQHLFAR